MIKLRYIVLAVLLGASVASAASSITMVPEGNVGIVTKFGKFDRVFNPGLNFKLPFVENVEIQDMRVRKNVETFTATSSGEQVLPNTRVSVNYTVSKKRAGELFKVYGTIANFEETVLDPMFISASKAGISQYTINKLVTDRSGAEESALQLFDERVREKNLPISIGSTLQIESMKFPTTYIDAINKAQSEKKLAEAETYKLERFAKKAERTVKTAEQEASALAIKQEAQVSYINAVGNALSTNPEYLDKLRIDRWDGEYPSVLSIGGTSAPDMILPLDSLAGNDHQVAGKPSAQLDIMSTNTPVATDTDEELQDVANPDSIN